jgi:cysteine desulfurase/selenocysteine lyase
VWTRLRRMRESQELPEDAGIPADPPEAGILTLRLPDPEAVASRLEADGVYARSIPYPASLRICTHYLTSYADLQRLTDALAGAWRHGAREQVSVSAAR